MAKVKISLIGAGSAAFSLGIVRDVCLIKGLAGSTVSFMDINEERLETIYGLARRYVEEIKADLKVERTTDRWESLENADFVINSALVVSHKNEEIQWQIARKHGYRRGYFMNSLLGDEAFFTTFYQWKLIKSIIHDMEELCPEAWYIQSANPQFAGLHERTHCGSKVKRVGLCHGGPHGIRHMAKVLGLDWDKVKAQVSGMNHFVWLTHFSYKSHDAYPMLDEWIEKKAKQYWNSPQFNLSGFMSPKAVDLYETFGLFPVGDTCTPGGGSWPWWYHADEATEKHWKEAPDNAYQMYHKHLKKLPKEISRIVADHSASVAEFITKQEIPSEDNVSIINALANDKPGIFQVNIPNNDAIPDLADDVIVDIPALVGRHGIHGLRVGDLPRPIMLQMKLRLIALEYELEAYITGSKNLLLQMILLEPWTKSMKQAKAVLDEILSLPFNEDMAKHFK